MTGGAVGCAETAVVVVDGIRVNVIEEGFFEGDGLMGFGFKKQDPS